MPHEPRAILFDLDDTLYPLRRFVLSGFRAVARYLAITHGVGERETFARLVHASRQHRGRELQACLRRLGLSDTLVAALVDVIRRHEPELRLPRASAEALAALRPSWRIGIVTNGFPDIQTRKIRALGLDDAVDTVVYATAWGSGGGKPEREPFVEALHQLGVEPARAVFVGDDARCDLFGASRVGMRTIYVAGAAGTACYADAQVKSLAEVPAVAESLVEPEWVPHVA